MHYYIQKLLFVGVVRRINHSFSLCTMCIFIYLLIFADGLFNFRDTWPTVRSQAGRGKDIMSCIVSFSSSVRESNFSNYRVKSYI